jgi:hypothetical protein
VYEFSGSFFIAQSVCHVTDNLITHRKRTNVTAVGSEGDKAKLAGVQIPTSLLLYVPNA